MPAAGISHERGDESLLAHRVGDPVPAVRRELLTYLPRSVAGPAHHSGNCRAAPVAGVPCGLPTGASADESLSRPRSYHWRHLVAIHGRTIRHA